MKQFVIIIICFVIIILGGIAQINYLVNSKDYFLADLDYIDNMILNNNYEKAQEQINLTYNNWEESKNVWNMFVNHEEIDDIDEALIELKENIAFRNFEDYDIAMKKLRNNITHVVERQKVKIDNIF